VGSQRHQPEFIRYFTQGIDHDLVRLALDETDYDLSSPPRETERERVHHRSNTLLVVTDVEYCRR